MKPKGRILFVDDEKRVLNSMRGMFRRDYELYLTTEGAQAVSIAAEEDVDVIVADQRMPGMTGVEVLEKVGKVSPRTVRILLTGYADPEAIQKSINVGEVFRFLSKPCPPSVLRQTLTIAVEAANAAPPAAAELPDLSQRRSNANSGLADRSKPRAEIVLAQSVRRGPATRAAGSATEAPQMPGAKNEAAVEHPVSASAPLGTAERAAIERPGREETVTARTRNLARSIGVVVFTEDDEFARTASRAIENGRPVTIASSLGEVIETLERHRAGVFLTDKTDDSMALQSVIGALKEHLPEIVTIVVSDSRDANDMVRLINYGQIYRYAVKPVETLTLRIDITAAVLKHLQLLNHPELIQRHRVVESRRIDLSPTINRFIGKMSRLRELWAAGLGKSH